MADRGTQTGGSEGGRGRGIPLGAGSQTVKGMVLVGAAVVLGIVLLQVVDPGKSGVVAGRKRSTASTTSTTLKHTTKPTTPPKVTRVKTPAQLRLLVLNAGAPSGSAGTVSTTLRGKGYTNQGQPGNDPNQRVGKTVLCRAGLTREASTLQVLLGSGTTKSTLGTSAPPGSAGFDCVVLVGGG